MTAGPKNADVHRQALLAAAIVAAEVRDEAEDGRRGLVVDRTISRAGDHVVDAGAIYRSGWYEAADKIAKGLLELAEAGPPPRLRRVRRASERKRPAVPRCQHGRPGGYLCPHCLEGGGKSA